MSRVYRWKISVSCSKKMVSYKIIYKRSAAKELRKLDKQAGRRVFEAIEALASDPRPRGCVQMEGRPSFRIRVGDYRVVYEVLDKEMTVYVIRVGYRRDVYKK